MNDDVDAVVTRHLRVGSWAGEADRLAVGRLARARPRRLVVDEALREVVVENLLRGSRG